MRTAPLLLVGLLLNPSPLSAGESRAVVMDGAFGDWRGLRPAWRDPAGDGPATGLDLKRLWLADDGDALYLRLQVGRETLLQNLPEEAAGADLELLVDFDATAETGRPVQGLGAELAVRFGRREVERFAVDGTGTVLPGGGAGVTGLPTHSASVFEIRVPLPEAGGRPESRELRLVVRERIQGGDRLPDTGTVSFRTSGERPEPLPPADVERAARTDFRLLFHNVAASGITRRQPVFGRLLAALRPDVIAFQEAGEGSVEEVRRWVEGVLPLPAGSLWRAERVADTLTLSSYPILEAAAVDGNLVVRVDLPTGPGGPELVLFNAHLPCCDDETGRDREADALAAAWRDMLEGRGLFEDAAADAVVFSGDFNFVGYRRQVEAVRDGVFVDPALGPPYAPGRARGGLATAPLRHLAARTTITWRHAASPFAPGRLDWVFYSGDRLGHRRSFVLDTAELSRAERRPYRLRRRDTDRASDHLPLVVDFRVKGSAFQRRQAERRGTAFGSG